MSVSRSQGSNPRLRSDRSFTAARMPFAFIVVTIVVTSAEPTGGHRHEIERDSRQRRPDHRWDYGVADAPACDVIVRLP